MNRIVGSASLRLPPAKVHSDGCPHQSFHWQGIDGTTVLAHMLSEETYNSRAAPRSVRKIERNYRDSGISVHALMVMASETAEAVPAPNTWSDCRASRTWLALAR